MSYRDWGVASGLRGRGLVADDQLGNLGFKAEIARTLLDFDVAGDLPASWVIIPGARWFANAASPDPNSGCRGGLTVSDGRAVETGVVAKLEAGPGVQVAPSAGPGGGSGGLELAAASTRTRGRPRAGPSRPRQTARAASPGRPASRRSSFKDARADLAGEP